MTQRPFVNVNDIDHEGNSALHHAARSGMTGICGLLIDRGLPVDAGGEGGVTALQMAILAGKNETAKYLARRGASIEQKNDAGASALDLVGRAGDQQLTEDLKVAAATRNQ